MAKKLLFGIFMQEMRRGLSQAAAFHDAFRLVDAAEAWGLDGGWLGEMHFDPARSVLSAPIVVAGAIARRASSICLASA